MLLRCALSVEWSYGSATDPLLLVNVHPLGGFTHPVKGEKLSSLFKEVGLYHISLLFESDAVALRAHDAEWATWTDQAIEQVYSSLDGWTGVIKASYVEGTACVIITDFLAKVCPKALQLHRYGSYHYKTLTFQCRCDGGADSEPCCPSQGGMRAENRV